MTSNQESNESANANQANANESGGKNSAVYWRNGTGQRTFNRKKENGEDEKSTKTMYAYKVLDMERKDEGVKVWEVSRSWSDNIDNLLVKGFLTLEVKRTGAATDTSYLFAPVVKARDGS